MENDHESDATVVSFVMNELVQGRDLAKQLEFIILSKNLSLSSSGLQRLMIQNIVESLERSIKVLQSNIGYQQSQLVPDGVVDSSISFVGSISQDSDGEFKNKDPKDESYCGKRKRVARWTQKVQGCSSTGLDSPIDDGYNWRKYGQKDIFGANYPRGYFRCTLRKLQGCMATKQVQRCDEDPSFFQVTYVGTHTCTQHPPPSLSSPSSPHLRNPTSMIKPDPIGSPQQTIWSFQMDRIEPIGNMDPSYDDSYVHLGSTSLSTPPSSSSGFHDHSDCSLMIMSPDFMFDYGVHAHDDSIFHN